MADSATEFIDATTAAVFIPEIWSQESIVARESRLVFASLVDRRFEKGLKYGDTIYIPTVGNLAARSKAASDNTAITYETITETGGRNVSGTATGTSISIATWEYAAIAIESATRVQANRDLLQMYAGKMGYALDLAVDDALSVLVDNLSQAVGSLAVSSTYEDVLRAVQYLDDADVPEDDRAIIASPAQVSEWMKLDAFIHADYSAIHGKAGAPAGRAYSRSWLDIPVYRSTNVNGTNAAGHDNALLHKEALALVMQMKPTAHSMYDIDYLVDKVVLEQLYGVAEIRDNHGVWIKGA